MVYGESNGHVTMTSRDAERSSLITDAAGKTLPIFVREFKSNI